MQPRRFDGSTYDAAVGTAARKAMGRLDAVPGRPPLDRPTAAPDETVELWVDEDPQGAV